MRCSIHKSSLQTRRPCLRPLPLLMHSSYQNKTFTAPTCPIANCFIAVARVCSAKQRESMSLHQARVVYRECFALALRGQAVEVR